MNKQYIVGAGMVIIGVVIMYVALVMQNIRKHKRLLQTEPAVFYIENRFAVESIHPSKGEIIINQSGEKVTLECPMVIYKLLETDREYLITYEAKQDSLDKGKINIAQLVER